MRKERNMKKTLIALALVAGVMTTFIACEDNHEDSEYKENQYVTVTDTNGEAVTDTNGEVVTELVTNAPSNGGASGLEQGGANTEDGWGQIITP